MTRNRFGGKDFRMDTQRAWALMPATGIDASYDFVQATHGFNATTSSAFHMPGDGLPPSNFVEMKADENISAYGVLATPPNYIGNITIKSVFITTSGASGNVLMQATTSEDNFSPDFLSGNTSGSLGAITISANPIGAYKLSELDMSFALTEQRLIRLRTHRVGDNASDTYGDSLYFLGWEINYG